MRLVLVIFIMSLLVASTMAKKEKKIEKEDILFSTEFSFYDFGTFMGGVFRGIEVGVNPQNASKCFIRADAVGSHFGKAFQLLSIGFTNVSADVVNQSIDELGNGFEAIYPLLKDCGSTQIVIDIAKIVRTIKTGGITALATQEGLKIFAKKGEISTDLRGITANFQAGNYDASGESLVDLQKGFLLNLNYYYSFKEE
ncbi:hypothetical protein PPL_12623 [Heterostelium album PN500]|uniref:Uncharacterized protein n=1 Tax=Heterostelium pallidum (strain ATCC 26659 / Pp 5 / PN500) TaxID=670386 RepID=D3BN45_HETP5|nr:hypothetical protein PPL_12623 [Heterostelium album PN500]EFA77407.1 hypothetical protein PPL_12623 [Heterostelium album PN500]|eukprot:XP_020429536.1 hypothetical protein PPL_12623 [Heterostelium album PN500]